MPAQTCWHSLTSGQTPLSSDASNAQSASKSEAFKNMIQDVPEVVRIPFEDAVKDIHLQGWEDEWFSSANFDIRLHGALREPKIDFVYNCQYIRLLIMGWVLTY